MRSKRRRLLMRVLVTWGSKRGGTEGIARVLGDALRREGFDVDVLAPAAARRAREFDAAIVGGALYANRWHRDARRFVARQEKRLRTVPVWFFSSGPLDDSADHESISPTAQVRALMERVGARGHVTFGGRLAPDAHGFPASAMAKKHAGDFRREDRVVAWASEIAQELPTAGPGLVVAQPGRSPTRLVLHATVGWALCAVTMGILLRATTQTMALVVHGVAAPVIFAGVASHYFRQRGARGPLTTALAFTSIVAALDLVVVAGLIERSLAMFRSVAGSWLPLMLIFAATWVTGESMSTLPWPKPTRMPPSRA